MIRHRKKGQEKQAVVVDESLLKRNYEDLANAIIVQACADYIRGDKNPQRNRIIKDEVEEFLSSSYFGILTKINPHWLLLRLKTGNIKIFKDYY